MNIKSLFTNLFKGLNEASITTCPKCNQDTLSLATYQSDGNCSNCEYTENVTTLNKREKEKRKSDNARAA